jgi:hypothetical protein
VKVLSAYNADTVNDPCVALFPDHAFDATHSVASDVDQFSVVESPHAMLAGPAVIDTIGTGGLVTFISTEL